MIELTKLMTNIEVQ
jgi:hypothetical protein